MVTPATMLQPPPQSWDEFENICADLFGREWNDPKTTRYGRQGQRQNGVDIYGRPDGEKYSGVQCKGRSVFPPAELTIADIDAEVEKAKAHKPALKDFTIATTGKNDAKLQDYARELTEKHEEAGLFSVHVVGWSEIYRRLTQHADLIDKHYGFVSTGQLRDEVRTIPEIVRQTIREELPKTGAAAQAVLPLPATAPSPAATQALERDLTGRYEAALQRSLFPEFNRADEFQSLADDALADQYANVAESLRRRVILRAARSAAAKGSIERSETLLSEAQRLAGDDPDRLARARILEAKGHVQGALALLRDEKDADSRSTELNILYRSRGAADALSWMSEEKLDVPDLTINGVHTLCLCHLATLDIESLRTALSKVTADQIKEAPYFPFLRAAANLASVLPKTDQDLPLASLPLEVMHARVVLPDGEAAARLDSAATDLRSFIPIAATMGFKEARRLAEGYAIWCELLHPTRKDAALATLRDAMKDPKTALGWLQFAFAYDREFNPDDITQYLERREQRGGLDDSEVRAMLVLRLHRNDASGIASLIAKYRDKMEAAFPPLMVTNIEIQALAKAGDATSARMLLNARAGEFSTEARASLEAEVSKAEGADPVQANLRLYEETKTVDALRALLASVGEKEDHRAVARYSEELYARTEDPRDIARAALALNNVGDSREFLRVMGLHPFLQTRDPQLANRYGWALFHSGNLSEAKQIAERLRNWTPPARDLHLEIAVAIESGEWEALAVALAGFLDNPARHSGLELIRAAHLAQTSSQGPMMDLLKAAIAKGEPDPNVWLGAYSIVMEEGLEDDIPEAHEWFQRALALSGTNGPIQRVELKDLLPQQQEWNERTRTISESIVSGETPLIIAATGLRTSVIDIVLRNLIRNTALTDPRRRVALTLFSGTRPPAGCGILPCLALDISALMVMGWLGVLPKVLAAFSKIALPATIMTELFEGRRQIQKVQKSRIRRAEELEEAVARGRAKITQPAEIAQDAFTDEVGPSLAAFIRAAEAENGIVLRPAPVHKPGLEQIVADVTAYTSSLADMQMLLAVLVDHGAIDKATEDTAKRYFDLQDKRWANPARPDPNRPLFIDGLALIYLQYTGLLDTVLTVFKDVRIEADAHEEALIIIENNHHVTEALTKIDEIRNLIRDANTAGKIQFGCRREELDDDGTASPSTLHLLSDLSGADAVACDDRALNKEAFAQDVAGKRIRAYSTLDIIEELKSRSAISEDEWRGLRHKLRVGGAVLVPLEASEIASAAMRSGAAKSAELRAMQESIDLARVSEVPSFPREVPWFAALNMAAKSAILEVWKTEPNHNRAAAVADMLLELWPNPEDWIACWGSHPPPEWVDAVRSVSVASMCLPVELGKNGLVAAYNKWLEARILEPMRAAEPLRYRRVVEQIRSFIETRTGEEEENETTS